VIEDGSGMQFVECTRRRCPAFDESGLCTALECTQRIPTEPEQSATAPVEDSQSTGSAPNLDQMALNHVASEMRKTAMKFVNDKDHARLMRAGELLAKAIEKDASRIGAKGLMTPNHRI